MHIPGIYIETVQNPLHYTYAQIEQACALAQVLGRGKFVLAEPPRRPQGDLDWYAAARGLEPEPTMDPLRFNVVRGTLPGGIEGVIFHRWPCTVAAARVPLLVGADLAAVERVRAALAVERPAFQISLQRGRLQVETNGYLNDAASLDSLAGTLAHAARQLCYELRAAA